MTCKGARIKCPSLAITRGDDVNIHNLDNIFKPKRVAMLGIGMNPKSVGGKILSNLVSGG